MAETPRAQTRTIAIVVGTVAASALAGQLILPGGLQLGVLLFGAIIGSLSMLTAAGLVLMYRSARIVNFAHVALGSVGAALAYELAVHRDYIPYGLGMVVGLLAGPVMGLLVGGLISITFFRHPRLVVTITTIVVAAVVVALEGFIIRAFRVEGQIGNYPQVLGPFPGVHFEIDGLVFRTGHLLALVMAVAAAVALAVFLRATRFGAAVRGSAENADRASLLGINVKAVATGVWVIAGALSAVGAIGGMPVLGYAPGSAGDPGTLLPALTAAVLGRMRSLPVAMGSAFAIAVARTTLYAAYQRAQFLDALLFVAILVALLRQRAEPAARQAEQASWQAQREVRPLPEEMLVLAFLRHARRAGWIILGAFLLAFPWIVTPGWWQFGQEISIVAIIGVSLVMLTGWSGQISLGQYALAGVGAFAEGMLAVRFGVPFAVAVPLSALLAAGFAVLVGLPALRIRGLYLAVTTFALAVVLPVALFDRNSLGRILPVGVVRRPKLLFIDFADDRSFYYLMLLALLATLAAARALRRGRTGRVLVGLRDDEAGAQALSIDPARARLSAFALSGFVAGMAGALLVHQARGIGEQFAQQFNVGLSLQVFIMTVVGGVSALAGPVLGALYFLGVPKLLESRPEIAAVITQGISPILVLLFLPGGLVQGLVGARDAVLRVVAIRNRIVVPSLFADYSPQAWAEHKLPLSQPAAGRGLAVLGADDRFDLPSKLWRSNVP